MLHRAVTVLFGFIACGGTSVVEPAPVPAPRESEKLPAGAADCTDAPASELDHLAGATGTRIALEGVPHVSVACTEKACTDGRACCNSCGGEYVLHDDKRRQVNLRGLPGCNGMDCDYVCEPFGRKPTRSYRFVGTYDHENRVLQVEKFCISSE